MHFRYFETDRVELDYWIAPKMFGVRLATLSIEDEQYLNKISDYCFDEAIYMISNLIYFDSIEDRTMFVLQWL